MSTVAHRLGANIAKKCLPTSVLLYLEKRKSFKMFIGFFWQEPKSIFRLYRSYNPRVTNPKPLYILCPKNSLIRQNEIFDSEYFLSAKYQKAISIRGQSSVNFFMSDFINSTSEFMLLWKHCFWSPQMQLSCFQQALCGWILNNIISRCMPACCRRRVLYLQLKFFIGKW